MADLAELEAWAKSHAALNAGRGNVDDVLGFIAWAKTGEPSLDAAWAEAEAVAEAKGCVVYGIHRVPTGWWAGATSGSLVQELSVYVPDGSFGPTPVAALRAVAAKLREAPETAVSVERE